MQRICTGTYKNGTPCTSKAKLGGRLCGRHEPPRVVIAPAVTTAAVVTVPAVIEPAPAPAPAPPRVTVRQRALDEPVFLGLIQPPIHHELRIHPALEAILIADDMIDPHANIIAWNAAQAPYVADAPGTINAAAFASDSQNVHRSSTLDSTRKCIETLLARPRMPLTTAKLIDTFEDRCYSKGLLIRRTEYAFRVLSTFERDCEIVSALDASYGAVAQAVLAFIGDAIDPLRVLVKEIEEGMGMCSTGKMCRLVNSIRGFDLEMVDSPPMTVFFERMSKLTDLPADARLPQARALFVEFNVPPDKQAPWLELLED